MDEKGFSFIELMVVIVIMSILATAVVVNLIGAPGEAKQAQARVDIKTIETALKMYRLDNGAYPSTEQGLLALVEAPETGTLPKKWRKGGYLEQKRIPKDPWKNELVYLCPGSQGDYDIISYGGDGVPGGEDENTDINNWEIE
ncbi:MAG: type II secretion system major pseudopilin GspG [Desulfobacula sp.]|nr:type II secretion system major pseudopilin GspG [Desulfobacula sp.]